MKFFFFIMIRPASLSTRIDTHFPFTTLFRSPLLGDFRGALAGGRSDRLAALLSDEIVLSADGGGKAAAIREPLHGKAGVLTFIMGPLRTFWADYEWRPAAVDGGLGVLLLADGEVTAAVTFGYDDDGRVSGIFILRNPDKLARLRGGPALPS